MQDKVLFRILSTSPLAFLALRFTSDVICFRTEMRFRAKISEGVHIRRFDTIVSAIAKIAKTCVMRLTPGIG